MAAGKLVGAAAGDLDAAAEAKRSAGVQLDQRLAEPQRHGLHQVAVHAQLVHGEAFQPQTPASARQAVANAVGGEFHRPCSPLKCSRVARPSR